MCAARAHTLVHSWDTVRYELLNTRICDMGLRIDAATLVPFVERLYREASAKRLPFQPTCYLTDSWGCPDQIPVIGIPFYLADERLIRIEEEQTGEVESDQRLMMLLRHETGHAYNYAYRLYEMPEWREVFGAFEQPYRDNFRPNPFSRQFVRHFSNHPNGRSYAQKHPDEDFAETFAVWLTPRSGWRRKYRLWPALRKLAFVDRLMRTIRGQEPLVTGGKLCTPVEEMTMLLAEHYGQRVERYRAAAQGYVDDKLREVFPPVRGQSLALASDLIRRHSSQLVSQVIRWSALDPEEVLTLLSKLEDRADVLCLQYRRKHVSEKLMDLTALATSLAMDFSYTGRLTG